MNLEVVQPKGVRILQPHALVAAGNMLKGAAMRLQNFEITAASAGGCSRGQNQS